MSKCWGADLSAPELLVLLAMADHADDDGAGVRPGVELLGAKTGLDPRSVRRIQGRLIQKGILLAMGFTTHGVAQYTIELDHIVKTEEYSRRRKLHRNREHQLTEAQLTAPRGADPVSPVTLSPPLTLSPLTLSPPDPVPLTLTTLPPDPDDIAYKESEPSEPLNHKSADALESSLSEADGDEEEPSERAAYTDEQKLPVFAERADFLKRYAQVNGIVPNLQQQREYLTSWAFKNGIDVGIVLQMCSSPKESAA